MTLSSLGASLLLFEQAIRGLPSIQEKSYQHPLYPIVKPKSEGYLQVSKVHSLYYATYGNAEGIPIVVLHGGPGMGCSDKITQFFDLEKWHVIMFDQRGAVRSLPLACMEENTPQHSVSDIETLRKSLGIDKWMVFGGSWGSALALLYAQEHADRCLGLILRGICLVREEDYLHLLYGMGKIFPEAYEQLVNYIPESERDDLLSAYYRRIMDPNPEVHMPAARTFIKYDFICGTHLPDPENVAKILENDQVVISLAKAFFYYSIHQFFLEPNQILSNLDKITHLPAIIVQGRWDVICPPHMSYMVHKRLQNSRLWIIPDGGHSAYDPPIGAALAEATDIFANKF